MTMARARAAARAAIGAKTLPKYAPKSFSIWGAQIKMPPARGACHPLRRCAGPNLHPFHIGLMQQAKKRAHISARPHAKGGGVHIQASGDPRPGPRIGARRGRRGRHPAGAPPAGPTGAGDRARAARLDGSRGEGGRS